MIGFLVTAGFIFWLVMQSRPKAAVKWKARGERLKPLGRYLRADAQALWKGLKRPQRLHVPDTLEDFDG